jgi:flagellar biogenesis protein FliO
LIGSNFQGWVMRGLAIALALITVAVLIVKRLPRKKKTRR